MTAGHSRTSRQRRVCLAGTITAFALAAVAGVWALLHSSNVAQMIDAALVMMIPLSIGIVGGVFLMVDGWANRYAQAFEVGYRLRDLDDEMRPVPEQRLRLVQSRPESSS